MVERGKLEELLGRIEAATWPDRSLDYRLAYIEGWRFNGYGSEDATWLSDEEFDELTFIAGGWKRTDQPEWPYPGRNHNEVAAFTASIDAALALVERVKPDANCSGFDRTPLGIDAYISRNNVTTGHWLSEGHHKTSIPLAVIAALLRALLAEAGTPT